MQLVLPQDMQYKMGVERAVGSIYHQDYICGMRDQRLWTAHSPVKTTHELTRLDGHHFKIVFYLRQIRVFLC